MFQPRPVHLAQYAGPNPPDYFGHGAQPARKPKADQTCPEIHLLSNFSSQKKKKNNNNNNKFNSTLSFFSYINNRIWDEKNVMIYPK
jgi:hypothetical protein